MSTTAAATPKPRAIDSLKRVSFWNIGGLFFFYFAIWQIVQTNLAPWLSQQLEMSEGNIGLLQSMMALTALCLQPFYGYIQDRLGFRKNLFAFVVVMGALLGPFFAFVFPPIVDVNQVMGAVVGGIFLSLVLNSGVSVVEAFNERNSRANAFEYGHVRLFGSLAGATASLVGGLIWAANPDNIWWFGTFSAIVLGALLFALRTPRPDSEAHAQVTAEAKEKPKVSKDVVLRLMKDRSFVGFMILMFGTAALYDVFDGQFAIYFGQHVTGTSDPQVLFNNVVFVQILLEAAVMVVMPFIINKIGAKRGLQLYALILAVRVVGSAFITSTEMLIVWRLLASIEMPLMLVSVWKYITRMFDVQVSATAYMIGFNTAKQIGVFLFSYVFGLSYEAIGFSTSYVVMGVVVLAVLVASSLLMKNDKDVPDPVGSAADGDAGARVLE